MFTAGKTLSTLFKHFSQPKFDRCKVYNRKRDRRREKRKKERKEGRKEGMMEERKEGREEGRKEGKIEGRKTWKQIRQKKYEKRERYFLAPTIAQWAEFL